MRRPDRRHAPAILVILVAAAVASCRGRRVPLADVRDDSDFQIVFVDHGDLVDGDSESASAPGDADRSIRAGSARRGGRAAVFQ